MATMNFVAPVFLLFGAVTICPGLRNHPNHQDKFIDFGLNITLASKAPLSVGLETFYRSHREHVKSAILKRVSATKMHLLLSLLLLSGDVKLNPGPQFKYPCGNCGKLVKANQRGIQCDSCNLWYHIHCMQMCSEVYQGLEHSSSVSLDLHILWLTKLLKLTFHRRHQLRAFKFLFESGHT